MLPSELDSPQQFLIMLHRHGKTDFLTPLLLEWAAERKETHHGLAIAPLLALELDCMSPETLINMYPTYADIRTALMTLFQTDRVFEEPGDEDVQYVPSERGMNVPWTLLGSVGLLLAFARAHEYVIVCGFLDCRQGLDGPRGLSLFCYSFVLPDFDGEETNY